MKIVTSCKVIFAKLNVVDETVARILTAEHPDERILVTLEQFAYGVAFDSDCEAY